MTIAPGWTTKVTHRSARPPSLETVGPRAAGRGDNGEVHGHGCSAGVVVVASGTPVETFLRPDEGGLVSTAMPIHTDGRRL